MTHPPASDILDLLRSLVDKSLVVYEEHDGVGRYRLLETVRQYARERLTESGEAEVVQDRAASWFLGLAEEAKPQLRGPEQGSWLRRLETEHDNLRASLSWYERWGDGGEDGLRLENGLRLAGALSRFWNVHDHFTEGRRWLGRALARTTPEVVGLDGATGREPSAARAEALNGAGVLAQMQGDYAEARALYEESLTIRRQLGNQRGIAATLNNLGNVARDQGDYAGARALYEESLTIYQQLGDQGSIADLLTNLGIVAFYQGDYAGTRALYEESLTIYRQLGNQGRIADALGNLGLVASEQGDYAGARALHEESLTIKRRQLGNQRSIAATLMNLGNVVQAQGDYAGARALFEESLTILRPLGEQQFLANALDNLGDVASEQGEYAGARALYEESLTIYRQLGDQRGIAEGLEGMAGVAQGQGRPGRAARLGAAASALRESIGSPLPPGEQEKFDKHVSSTRAALGDDAFTQAWNAGLAMTLKQAVDFALETRRP